jgi:hypothetical protein
VHKLRDTVIGILILAAVFVVFQGGVGYFGLPRTSLWYWVVPGSAVLLVVWWYFRSSDDDDWRTPG